MSKGRALVAIGSKAAKVWRGSGRKPRKATTSRMEAAAGERAGQSNVRDRESLKANRVQAHAKASHVPSFTEPAECRDAHIGGYVCSKSSASRLEESWKPPAAENWGSSSLALEV